MATEILQPEPIGTESPDDLEAHVQRMLQSPHFARADTQRKLLAYLWEHRYESVSEYALATEALGRHSSFDSTVDASVRVHISRLRKKLKDYYEREQHEPELLVIPTGTHQLMVMDHAADAQETDASQETISVSVTKRWVPYFLPVLTGICVILMATVGILSWKLLDVRRREPQIQKPSVFWNSFLQGTTPIKIILPTPVFFGFSGAPSIRLRSTQVNDFHEMEKDPRFMELAKTLGKPTFEQSYTVTWDTLAAIDMARYLDSIGAQQRVSFEVTRDSSMMILEQANVIAVGTHQTLQPLHEYLEAMNFSLTLNEARVTNAKPLPGEKASYEIINESSKESQERIVRPSIIALLPGRAPGLKVLLLQSRDTRALVNLLSSSAGSHSIEEMWKQHGQPEFFEMVTETELENNHPLRTWPVAMHAFRSQAPANSM